MVSVGIIEWVEATVTEPSFFKLCTEHTPIHLALLDEVVTCHTLLHEKVGRADRLPPGLLPVLSMVGHSTDLSMRAFAVHNAKPGTS